MKDRYLLIKDLGAAKAKTIYIKGLHTHPNKKYGYAVNDLYWAEGVEIQEYNFFHKNTINEQYFKPIN